MPRMQMSYTCRKGVMCQHCLTAALPIVLPSLCLLSRFLANNGKGRLSLAISCTTWPLSRIYRDAEIRVWICGWYGHWTAGYCALHQCTAEWGREHACGRNATEWRKPMKNMLCSCRAIYIILCKVQPSSLHNCTSQACAIVASACVRCGYIYIYIHIAKSRIGRDH